MDRRKYLKAMTVGTLGVGVLQSCDPKPTQQVASSKPSNAGPERQPEEIKRFKQLTSETFFTESEMALIHVLVDIIIPKDDFSGSATEAGVPDFIEFIVKDKPHLQTPLRGGLQWLNTQSTKDFNKPFIACSSEQQINLIDRIAYPEMASPDLQPGVMFFNTLRDLTATGFFTSKMGIEDLGYKGNKPTQWDGVPQEVLDQFGLQYDERTLKESIKHNS